MNLQLDYADLCMTLVEKFGDDPSIPRSPRMLLAFTEAIELQKKGIQNNGK